MFSGNEVTLLSEYTEYEIEAYLVSWMNNRTGYATVCLKSDSLLRSMVLLICKNVLSYLHTMKIVKDHSIIMFFDRCKDRQELSSTIQDHSFYNEIPNDCLSTIRISNKTPCNPYSTFIKRAEWSKVSRFLR